MRGYVYSSPGWGHYTSRTGPCQPGDKGYNKANNTTEITEITESLHVLRVSVVNE